jgi:hypothetical protein
VEQFRSPPGSIVSGCLARQFLSRLPRINQQREGDYHGKASIRGQVPARLRHSYRVENDDFFNTVLSKSYKDGDDWTDTDQLGTGDLLNAAQLLERAEQFISEQ